MIILRKAAEIKIKRDKRLSIRLNVSTAVAYPEIFRGGVIFIIYYF